MSHFYSISPYDYINLVILIFFVCYIGYKIKVPNFYILLLILHSILPLCLNGFIFEQTLFPDQDDYANAINNFRGFESQYIKSTTVYWSSLMLTFVPIPFICSAISVGFINVFLYSSLFYVLYSNKYLTKVSALFYLLFPSLALYTALSLRDGLIFFLMVCACLLLERKRFILFFILLFPIYLIKFQNAVLLLMLGFLFFIYSRHNLKLSIACFGVTFIVSIMVTPLAIDYLDGYRQLMFWENVGPTPIQPTNGIFDFYFQLSFAIFELLIRPFPSEIISGFQFIQFIENVVVFICITAISIMAFFRHGLVVLITLFLLFVPLSIYGFVVDNVGTAVRYKFPFLMIYVLFVCYLDRKGVKGK